MQSMIVEEEEKVEHTPCTSMYNKKTASKAFQLARDNLSALIAKESSDKLDTVFYKEPTGYTPAIRSPESMYWRDAIQAEMDSIDAHDTYTEIKIPSYVNPKQMLTLRWV